MLELHAGRCARETVAEQGGLASGVPVAEGRSECATAEGWSGAWGGGGASQGGSVSVPADRPVWDSGQGGRSVGLGNLPTQRVLAPAIPEQPPCQGVHKQKCAVERPVQEGWAAGPLHRKRYQGVLPLWRLANFSLHGPGSVTPGESGHEGPKIVMQVDSGLAKRGIPACDQRPALQALQARPSPLRVRKTTEPQAEACGTCVRPSDAERPRSVPPCTKQAPPVLARPSQGQGRRGQGLTAVRGE